MVPTTYTCVPVASTSNCLIASASAMSRLLGLSYRAKRRIVVGARHVVPLHEQYAVLRRRAGLKNTLFRGGGRMGGGGAWCAAAGAPTAPGFSAGPLPRPRRNLPRRPLRERCR